MKGRRSIAFITVFLLAWTAPVLAAKLSAKGEQFAKEAAMGGIMEVQLGSIAQEKAHSPEVKEFAARMVRDHGKANRELMDLAKKNDLVLPEKLDQKHQMTVDELKKASAAEFDRQYMREMVKDHTKDVAKFREASRTVEDAGLKAWAEQTLPVLEDHLQHARKVAEKVGVEVKKAEEEGRQAAQGK